MATWDDVRAHALALPETSEGTSYGHRAWKVRDKGFVWERPLRPRDLDELGERAPPGPILGARAESLHAREALLQSAPEIYFTTSHFDGSTAVLVRLDAIGVPELHELVVEAWLARAPPALARAYADEHLPEGAR